MFKKIAQILVLLVAMQVPVMAQVAFDAGSEHQNNNDGSASFSHTTSGSDRFLMVGCVNSESLTFTGATYNGASMGSAIIDTLAESRKVIVWGLVNPASGANTVEVTWSDGNREPYCQAMSFSGVDQSTPYDTIPTTASGFGTSSSQSITSEADDMVVQWVVTSGGITGWTAGAGETEIHQAIGGGAAHNLLTSYEAGDTSVTMSSSWTGGTSWRTAGMNLNAGGAGPPPSSCAGRIMLMGAGKC
jgi:hypothetical protein